MRFVESKVWGGLPREEMAEVYSLIGPSLGYGKKTPSKLRGEVVKYNDPRAFGWLAQKDGSELFFHIRDCIDMTTIERGAKVAYEIGMDRKGKEIAVKVEKLRES